MTCSVLKPEALQQRAVWTALFLFYSGRFEFNWPMRTIWSSLLAWERANGFSGPWQFMRALQPKVVWIRVSPG